MALSLAACSSQPGEPNAQASRDDAGEVAAPAPQPDPQNATRDATPQTVPAASAPSAPGKVITLEGLGELRIGQPVPAGASWAERGAQTGDACRTVNSPDYPGVYAIITEGKVRRITVGQRSDVKLVEGIGVGASESDVSKWFAGFRAEPHKYEDAPAKYLTAPGAASGDPAVRFEIGGDRRVRMLHIGTMPVLGYVEGCA